MDALEGVEQHLGRVAVQRAGGLVGQQEPRGVDEGPGAGTALPLPARHLVRVLVQDVLDVQPAGHFFHAGLHRGGRGVVDSQHQGDVLSDGQGVQQVEVLKDEAQLFPAEPGQRLGAYLGHVLAVQINVAGADGVDGGNAVEQGGLAGAGSPHDPQKLPFLHREADVPDGSGDASLAAVIFLDVVEFEYFFHLHHLWPYFTGTGGGSVSVLFAKFLQK